MAKRRAGKAALRARFGDLARLRHATEQQRGFELERLLIDLAALEGLAALPPFRSGGEQIDGLIVLDCRHILLEAKWTAAPVSASEVYSFRSKVDGKLTGTLGLFVSVGGFAPFVSDSLRYGKEVNVLLADGEDVRYALDPRHSLSAVVRAKVTRAAQHGEVQYSYRRQVDARRANG